MDAYAAERAKLLIAFGAKLRALREPKFATQEDLGFAAKMHRTHIGFLERGRREPSLSTLLILAKTLEVPVQSSSTGCRCQRSASRRGQGVSARGRGDRPNRFGRWLLMAAFRRPMRSSSSARENA